MPFDRSIIEAQMTLGLIFSSDMPSIACDALEAGLDGPAIRRLAALESPTFFEVREILPRAMLEMGLVQVSSGVAAIRLAKKRANEILERGEDPLKQTQEFERLWIDAGYPFEMRSLETLDDEVYLARAGESDEAIRKWVVRRLHEFIS